MQPTLTPEAIAMICKHMNDDHADSIVAYAHHYASATDVTEAQITELTATAMTLQTNGAKPTLSIPFAHTLTDATDARETLIAMAREAAPSQPATTSPTAHTH